MGLYFLSRLLFLSINDYLGVQTIEMLEKLATFDGVELTAVGPFVKVNVEKFPVPFLSVSSIHTLYVPSATTVPATFVASHVHVLVA